MTRTLGEHREQKKLTQQPGCTSTRWRRLDEAAIDREVLALDSGPRRNLANNCLLGLGTTTFQGLQGLRSYQGQQNLLIA
jgi:hypothetical protein